ncbi:unnamed protein product [Sphagnum troendelagicum]|uniref:LAGLIDADG endonuclease n=1 Tax=Sphagnum troendelagicum TaxID=128251 RepID=A0ABP0UV47_9BRYO
MCVDTIGTSSFLSCILHNNNDKKSAKVQLRVMTFALLNTKPNIPLQVSLFINNDCVDFTISPFLRHSLIDFFGLQIGRRDVLPHHPTKGCGTSVSRCVTLAA